MIMIMIIIAVHIIIIIIDYCIAVFCGFGDVVISTYRMSGSGRSGSCVGKCSWAICRTYLWRWAGNGIRACWFCRSGASGRRRWICSWAMSGSPRSEWVWTLPCPACGSVWSPVPWCRPILHGKRARELRQRHSHWAAMAIVFYRCRDDAVVIVRSDIPRRFRVDFTAGGIGGRSILT